jgi:hypothetical protein
MKASVYKGIPLGSIADMNRKSSATVLLVLLMWLKEICQVRATAL